MERNWTEIFLYSRHSRHAYFQHGVFFFLSNQYYFIILKIFHSDFTSFNFSARSPIFDEGGRCVFDAHHVFKTVLNIFFDICYLSARQSSKELPIVRCNFEIIPPRFPHDQGSLCIEGLFVSSEGYFFNVPRLFIWSFYGLNPCPLVVLNTNPPES